MEPSTANTTERAGRQRLVKRVIVGLLVLAAAAVLAVNVDPTFVLAGHLRREPFCQGRPVSYWRDQLLDPTPGVQTNAVKAITDGGSSSVPVLTVLLGDTHYAEVRWMAAQALGNMGPASAAAVPALTAALDDPEALVRIAAADALGRIGPAAEPAVPRLAELLKTDEPVRVLKALRRIGANRAALPAVVEVLGHADAETRENAAEVLRDMGPAAKEARPALTAALEDPDPRVRQEAADALKALGAE